ncbi:DUF4178 domain-containing protein [Zoogloea sp.]|uniref:DUF4178 domain-containing protein n=1 Tax=Zoogloea sp. TaxID=49181 RepID=UPI0035AD7BD5
MFKLACPSCGAEVAFRSPTSALAVCAYCRSTLLRDGEAVRDVGKMSATLEDYSPIRVATAGIYAGRRFGVVGRIQLRYDDGFWNEWYLVFDDGGTGWLSDASGQYAVTLDTGLAGDAPRFAQIVPGGLYRWDGVAYAASDLRTARCTGGEGELPFRVDAGWTAKVADYRQSHRFLTLDYSDGDTPRRYAGKAVTLADLKCQFLRSAADIAASAGKLPGRAASLECPACGASIDWRPAVAAHLHCPACGTESDATGGTAQLLEAARREALVPTTLALGDAATIDGQRYTLIGLMGRRTTGSGEAWTEYLLFSEAAGFLWLAETATGWQKVKVLDAFPEAVSASGVRFADAAYTRTDGYTAEVTHAAGAFNWRVKVGDRASVTEYAGGRGLLVSERTPAEITWAKSQRVTAASVGAWFGKPALAAAAIASAGDAAPAAPAEPLYGLAASFSAGLFVLNLPIALFGHNGGGVMFLVVIGLVLLWAPLFSDRFGDAFEDGP